MEKSWIECTFPLPSAKVDEIADRLYDHGCLGVNVNERALDTFVVPDPDADSPASYQVKAYFPIATGHAAVQRQVAAVLEDVLGGCTLDEIEVATLGQEDWAEGWKQNFSVQRFGPRLVIRPTWEAWAEQQNEAVVTLDPGMAFGTGSHETTRLCLQALADCFDAAPAPTRVLDVGTGSGILAIAAAKLGAGEVVGIEIDAEACEVARDNVNMNGVGGTVRVTDEPLEALTARFDVVLANILAEENVRLAEHLVACLDDAAVLILSGILREKEAYVRAGFSRFGLGGPEVRYENEWCCICYRRD